MFVNWLAIPTRMENQAKVSHVDFSFKQSFQQRTPNRRSIDKPIIATTTLAMSIVSLQNQKTQIVQNSTKRNCKKKKTIYIAQQTCIVLHSHQ